jgi:hypothetical protein
MGLLETAAADLHEILSDDVGGFAVPIKVVDPSNRKATINGLATDIGFTINPDTGQAVAGQKISIALPLRALKAAGLGEPIGISASDSRFWKVTLTMPTGGEHTYKITSTMPDRLGCIVCFLEYCDT